MAGVYINRADSLLRRPNDKGYRVAWKLKYGFEKGHSDEDLTYAEAARKAEELADKDPQKTYWPEMIMDPAFK